MQDFVVFDHVCKTYQMGDVRIEALKDASFTIDEGEICVIVGQSGAGKTTLMNVLGGMDRLAASHVQDADNNVYGRYEVTLEAPTDTDASPAAYYRVEILPCNDAGTVASDEVPYLKADV